MIHDAIVLGLGGMGSAALFHLAKRGANVVGVDPYPPGEHANGSSHGETRVIRKAYFEHPDYVPLLVRAYELWRSLEGEWGEPLYHGCGVLQVGPENGEVIRGLDHAARLHGLPLDHLDAEEARRRFPGFVFPEGSVGRFESDAGILRVETCVLAHAKRARAHGAEIIVGEPATQLAFDDDSASISVGGRTIRGRRLVITAGPWAPALLADLGVPLVIKKKPSFWIGPPDRRFRLEGDAPAFLYETTDGVFYGLPAVSAFGVKVAEHSGGEILDRPLPAVEAGRPDPTPEEEARVIDFVKRALPTLGTNVQRRALCMYTMTPDQHFLIDRHPRRSQLIFATGFSGHGFKFASVVGEILADLALANSTAHSIGFLGLDRFGPH